MEEREWSGGWGIGFNLERMIRVIRGFFLVWYFGWRLNFLGGRIIGFDLIWGVF